MLADPPNEGPRVEMPPDGVDAREAPPTWERIAEVEAHRAELAERSAKLADGLLAEANAQRDEADRLLLAMVENVPSGAHGEPFTGALVAAMDYLMTRGLLPVTE